MPTEEQSSGGEIPSETGSSRALGVMSMFVIPSKEDPLFAPLAEVIVRANKPFDDIGSAFRANIEGLISTVSMPYKLAHTSSIRAHWRRIHMAARFEMMALDAEAEVERLSSPNPKPKAEETDEAQEKRLQEGAFERGSTKMSEFVRSAEGKAAIRRDTLDFLEALQSDRSLTGAANELILQGVVLCWGAFEVLARDCFVAHLDAAPARSITLLADPVAKRRFELSKVSLETLAAHSFDLSGRMGTLLAQQQDLSDIHSVKSIYQALFSNDAKLSDALSDSDLRLLSLRRNLIIHQRGIVDAKYKASTNCSQGVGDRLTLLPNDLNKHLSTTTMAVIAILDAVSVRRRSG
jgi:hypothetical protein